MIVLKERLNPAQWIAIGLAAAGVTYMTIGLGALPVVSLVLAFSFGFYALLRKRVAIEAIPGLTIETSILAPIGLVYVLVIGAGGTGNFLVGSTAMNWLLPAAGVVTVVPLLWFTAGARKLPMITIGMLQYLAPTGQLLLAVLAYDEAFRPEHAVAFGCIWTGLGIYTFDLVRRTRRRRRERAVIGKAKPA
jgi:chloramphenicol-sensitive protein RarD